MEQPVGPLVSITPARTPSRQALHGKYTSLIPLEETHSDALFKHLGGADNGFRWTYMMSGPYTNIEQWRPMMQTWSTAKDPLCFVVLSGPASDPTSEPVGMMSYMAITPTHRRIEIGSVILSASLQQTRKATEAFYLIIKHAFEELGYDRVEWKANKLNEPSLAAARRLGFEYEGIFRNHMIVKGRRRDTAWFSITDEEWRTVKRGFEAWLDESNFDENGKQIKGLKALREEFKSLSN